MCGQNRPGTPSMGSWITYGLGTENQNLPAFVVMHDQRPRGDDGIWSGGFLPKTYQPSHCDPSSRAIDNLSRPAGQTDPQQRSQLDLLRELNGQHAAVRPTQGDLAARISSFELGLPHASWRPPRRSTSPRRPFSRSSSTASTGPNVRPSPGNA